MSAAPRHPHLLYVAFAFPPSTASSVYRGLAVPNAFAAAGWDVTVLTIDGKIWSEISGSDPKLLVSVDPRITVERVSDGGAEDPAKGNLRRFSRLRVDAPFVWRALLSRRSRRLFPEKYHGLWLPVASEAARRIHREHPVDLVMATASPYVSFAVARALTGVPYVLDYRDAWAFHTFSGAPNFSPKSSTAKLEARYLEGAAQVWFVNAAIRDEYARLYPQAAEKMRVVPNGFDPQPGHAQPSPTATARPTFGYLGTVPHVRTPLQELLDGWAMAFGIGDSKTRPTAHALIRGKLSSSGRISPHLLSAFDDVRRHGMEYLGPLSKRDVPQFYRNLDALILLLPAGKYVTGGKTSEYLATGLPIVSVHDLSNATTDQLRDYPLWFPARDLTAHAIAEAFRECADELKNPDPARWSAAWEYGQQFLRSEMLTPVIAELTARISPGHTGGAVAVATLVAAPLEKTTLPEAGQVHPELAAAGTEQAPLSVFVVVLITEREGADMVIEDLHKRLGSVDGVESSLSVVSVDARIGNDDAHRTVWTAGPGALEKASGRMAALSGPAGMVGRMVREVLVSNRIARAVRRSAAVIADVKVADMVVAVDTRGIRSVWQFRAMTGASLVHGPVAAVHALRALT